MGIREAMVARMTATDADSATLLTSIQSIEVVDSTGRAIIDSAREEFVRFGFKRASMTSISERAGVSRVTVHRRFEAKPQLLRAVIMTDLAAWIERFDAYLAADGPLEGRVTELTILGFRGLRSYPLLQTLLRTDATQVLPLVTLDGKDEFELIRDQLALRVARLMDAGELPTQDPQRLAELLVRLTYSVILLPFGLLQGDSDDEIRAIVENYLMPILAGRG